VLGKGFVLSVKVTPAMRHEIITATGLCVNPHCTAHDDIVLRIWKYKEAAVEDAWEQGQIATEMANGIERIRS